MVKLSHTSLIVISGILWFLIGFFLLKFGLGLLLASLQLPLESMHQYPVIAFLQTYLGNWEVIVLFLIALALAIGYFKGRYVLGKSARRSVERILTFPNPTSIANIYSAKYYLLLAAMVGLGISFKYLHLSSDIRGFIDVAIGSALINGAMLYFRMAQEIKKEKLQQM